mmetsp:Transcript_31632/g.72727  ORF Transcript_31632/g.72727 Transcript_31632/m.72727 type:complete len:150 (-) Transcript_31632:36-485(-)
MLYFAARVGCVAVLEELVDNRQCGLEEGACFGAAELAPTVRALTAVASRRLWTLVATKVAGGPTQAAASAFANEAFTAAAAEAPGEQVLVSTHYVDEGAMAGGAEVRAEVALPLLLRLLPGDALRAAVKLLPGADLAGRLNVHGCCRED